MESVDDLIITDLSADDIDLAFSNSLFSLSYQPIFDLDRERGVVGVEAFARLNHPLFGEMPPRTFLPLVRKLDKTRQFALHIFSLLNADYVKWGEASKGLRVSINIDAELLAVRDLSRALRELFQDFSIQPENITLEVSALGQELFSSEECESIFRLRMKGFRMSLDGCDQSSKLFQQVSQLPFDEFKINRHLVSAIGTDKLAEVRIRTVLHYAECMGVNCIAVGIENIDQLAWLSAQGCNAGQGYFLGHPIHSALFCQKYLLESNASLAAVQANRVRILVVESDKAYSRLLHEVLHDVYQVVLAASISEGVALFEQYSPQLVIIDLHLSDGLATEFCRRLNAEGKLVDVSVVFTSSDAEPQYRLDAYSAGAVDYILKPFAIADLIAKVGRIADYHVRRSDYLKKHTELEEAVIGSLREASHYGDVVQFFKNLFSCVDEDGIARALFQMLNAKGLTSSLQLREGQLSRNFNCDGSRCSPMEVNVFEMLHARGRLYDFNARTICNDQHVSILIKNMPSDKEEAGRVRDYIAVIVEGVETCFRDILRQRAFGGVVDRLTHMTEAMSKNMAEHQRCNRQVIEKTALDLQMSFHMLDLSEEQESHILKVVSAMQESNDNNAHVAEEFLDQVNALLVTVNAFTQTIDLKADTSESQAVSIGVGAELF